MNKPNNFTRQGWREFRATNPRGYNAYPFKPGVQRIADYFIAGRIVTTTALLGGTPPNELSFDGAEHYYIPLGREHGTGLSMDQSWWAAQFARGPHDVTAFVKAMNFQPGVEALARKFAASTNTRDIWQFNSGVEAYDRIICAPPPPPPPPPKAGPFGAPKALDQEGWKAYFASGANTIEFHPGVEDIARAFADNQIECRTSWMLNASWSFCDPLNAYKPDFTIKCNRHNDREDAAAVFKAWGDALHRATLRNGIAGHQAIIDMDMSELETRLCSQRITTSRAPAGVPVVIYDDTATPRSKPSNDNPRYNFMSSKKPIVELRTFVNGNDLKQFSDAQLVQRIAELKRNTDELLKIDPNYKFVKAKVANMQLEVDAYVAELDKRAGDVAEAE